MLEIGINTIYGPDKVGRTAIASALFQDQKGLYITSFSNEIDRIPKDIYVSRIGDAMDFTDCVVFDDLIFYLNLDIIIVDSITLLTKLVASPKLVSRLLIRLENISKQLQIPIVLIADTYKDFDSGIFKLSGKGILNTASNQLIEVEQRGPKRLMIIKKKVDNNWILNQELEFKISGGIAQWEGCYTMQYPQHY